MRLWSKSGKPFAVQEHVKTHWDLENISTILIKIFALVLINLTNICQYYVYN